MEKPKIHPLEVPTDVEARKSNLNFAPSALVFSALLAACTPEVLNKLPSELSAAAMRDAAPEEGQGSGGGAPEATVHGTDLGEYMGVHAYSNGYSHGTGGTPYEVYGWEYQCVEYINRFLVQEYGFENLRGSGNANDYWTGDVGLQKYENGENCPIPGDIPIALYGEAGHIAMIREVGNDYVKVIQQNWDQNPSDSHYFIPMTREVNGDCTIDAFDYDSGEEYSIAGWLRYEEWAMAGEAEGEPPIISFTDFSPHEGAVSETQFIWAANVTSVDRPDVTLKIYNPLQNITTPFTMTTFSIESPWTFVFPKNLVNQTDYEFWVEAENDGGTDVYEVQNLTTSALSGTLLEIFNTTRTPEVGEAGVTNFTWEVDILSSGTPEAYLRIINPIYSEIYSFKMTLTEEGPDLYHGAVSKKLSNTNAYTYWIEADNGDGHVSTSRLDFVDTGETGGLGGGSEGDSTDSEADPAPDDPANCSTTVPTNHNSIQSAINASNDGDTICVEAGTYYENLVMDGRTINLQSLDGADVTTLDGMDIASTISVLNGSNGLIDGFTIQNGYDGFGLGGGIAIDGSSPTVQHSRITSNTFNGIDITNNSNPVIQNNVISDNMFNGVHVTDSSEPTLNNLTIVENWTAGVRSELNSNVTINNSVIVDNSNEGLGNDIGSTLVGDYNNVSGNAWGNYDVGVVAGVGSISVTPDFVDQTWFRLDVGSAGIDQGNPSAVVNDSNGSRNDMGAYGGPNGNW